MNPTQPKLLLIDAMALLYRAHFALMRSPRISKEGLNTSALFGFTNSLMSLLVKQAPTHLIVAHDSKGGTWRSEIYKPYKAHREAQPEDITTAIAYLPKLLDAFNIPMIEKKGYEADDVIGTLAQQASREKMTVYMVTPDKDFAQLVDKNIHWYKSGVGKKEDSLLEVAEVCEQWGVEKPSQVQDILGIWGDSSDNIPGIPTIGVKGAQKLIAKFGSIEGILARKDELTEKQQALFERYGEQALLSKKLATISTDVPLSFKLEEALYKGADVKKVQTLFEELDFRHLAKRLLKSETPPSGQLTLFSTEEEKEAEVYPNSLASLTTLSPHYRCVDTLVACQKLAQELKKQKRFALDSETTSLNPRHADLLGISIAYKPHHAYYIPLGDADFRQKVVTLLQPIFQNPEIEKIGQNLKYDMHILHRYDLSLRGTLFDTMIAHHLLYPDQRHGLNSMAETLLEYRMIPIEALIGKRSPKQKKMVDVPLEALTDYACEDADITLQLYEKLLPKLTKENFMPLFYQVEMPLLPVLIAMEQAGVTIDIEALESSSILLQKELNELTQEIYTFADSEFNIDSPKQLGETLFEKMQLIKNPTKTKTGQYATNEAILSKLVGKHDIIKKIRSYREIKKLKSTYIDALPNLMDPIDGRIHTSYQQSVVSTGRLSSTNPNLQNIPIRTERGRAIRKAFVSREKGLLLCADYSQVELRIMAHFSQDKNLIETFEAGEDVHRTTAAKLFNVKNEAVTEAQRRKAKMTNFSIIYGITPFGLAQRLDVSRYEAKEIIENYFLTFPGVKNYIDTTIEKARERGWVATLLGRKRFLPDINSRNATLRNFAERNAINMPIQGTQAEMIKKAMSSIFQWLSEEKLSAQMIMQVHDELVFDLPLNELPLLQKKIPALMEKALPLSLPVIVDLGVGENWLEAH